MSPRDLNSGLTITQMVNIAAKTATFNATGVDVSGYKGTLLVALLVGTVSGTTPTLDVKLQASADNSSWSDITGATFTQVTASDSYTKIGIDVTQGLKYLRAVSTIAGTTPSFTMGITVLGAKERV